jgi:uncharacterized protein YjiS (DUF1127 family)
MAHSFFRNAFARMTAAREKQARRYVHDVLLTLDDETLKSLGCTREEVRRGGRASLPF